MFAGRDFGHSVLAPTEFVLFRGSLMGCLAYLPGEMHRKREFNATSLRIYRMLARTALTVCLDPLEERYGTI
eukprot:scaffold431_cov103-Cylindrotheca_fusiformis.AAC.2